MRKEQVNVRDGSRLLRTHGSEHTGRPGPRSQVRKTAQAPWSRPGLPGCDGHRTGGVFAGVCGLEGRGDRWSC